jgi:hypothetical protein
MALKRSSWHHGTVVLFEHDSCVLRDNPLRDPHVRRITDKKFNLLLAAEY